MSDLALPRFELPAAEAPVGPKGLPVVGVAPYLRRDPLKYFVEMMLTYGDVVRFNVGFEQVVMLNNPAHIRHVLQDNHRNYHKSRFYRPLRPILGNGIFLSEGKEWLAQRRTAAPSFTGARVGFMAEQVVGATEEMLAGWHRVAERGEELDLLQEMMHVTLDGVCRAFLGVRIGKQHADLHEALATLLKETEKRVWSVFPLPEAVFSRTHAGYRDALATIDRVIADMIEERRRNPGEGGDILTALIQAYDAGDNRDPKLLRDQVISIVTAGHETTAISMTWAFYLLSKNPAVERRLHAEVDEVLGDRTPGLADLKQLTYTRMVFEEAMRLFPPVWTISREAQADDSVDGVDIPAGTTVMLSPYAVHRHPAIWDNPEGFDPERFAPGMEATRPRHAYFPFGGGPRTCLGNRFSIMEAQLMLAMIAQRYRVSLRPEHRPIPQPMITLRPNGTMPMRLRPRRPGAPVAVKPTVAGRAPRTDEAVAACPFH